MRANSGSPTRQPRHFDRGQPVLLGLQALLLLVACSGGLGSQGSAGAAGQGASGTGAMTGQGGATGMAGQGGTTGTGGFAGQAGTTGTGGISGQGGTVGSGGTAGQGGTVGSGGTAGRGGTGGFPCVPTRTCTPSDVDTTAPDNSCTVEAAFCDQLECSLTGQPFMATYTCCGGKWWRRGYGARTCPTQPNPGDPFECPTSDRTISCTAGQTYCAYSIRDKTVSCQPLCAAGDCSCMCGQANACDFDPPDKACPGDRCYCRQVNGADIPLKGAFFVSCFYSPGNPGVCDRDPSADRHCTAASLAGVAIGCYGGRYGHENCAPLPDSFITLTCGGTEVHYWCCPG